MRYVVLIAVALLFSASCLWAADYRNCVQGVWQTTQQTPENGKASSAKTTTEFTRNGTMLYTEPGYGSVRGNYKVEGETLTSVLSGYEAVFSITTCNSHRLTLKHNTSNESQTSVKVAESKLLRYDGAQPLATCYKQLAGVWENPMEKAEQLKKGDKTLLQRGTTEFRRDGTILVRPVAAESLKGFYKVIGPEGAKFLKMVIDGSEASFVISRCDGDSMTLKRSDGQFTDYNRRK